MRRIIFFFIPFLVLLGCSKDDSPQPNTGSSSSVIFGDLIYTIIQGNNQAGAPGSLLSKEIRITIRNIDGSVVNRNLEFELSDESGSYSMNYYYPRDTLNIRWKLGCSVGVQTMTVTDPNVCGVAKNECLDIEIFEITANSDPASANGWVSPCLPFTYYNSYSFHYSNDRLAYVYNDMAYTTDDPQGLDWEISPPNDEVYYSDARMTTSGNLYYFSGYEIGILSDDGKNWIISSSPAGYLSYNDRLEKASNGNYYLATEYDESVYESSTGYSWSKILDIDEETGGASFDPQAIVAEGNYLYIVSDNNYVIELNVLTDAISTYSLGSYWPNYDDLGDFEVQAIGKKIFLRHKYGDDIDVIDLNSSTVQSFTMDSYALTKSDDKIYVINSTGVKYWAGTSFSDRSYNYPSHLENYSKIGMYNGYPILSYYGDNIYIYVN